MVQIKLHGALAEEIGQAEWELEITSPIELFRAIEVNTGRMISALQNRTDRFYRIIINGGELREPGELLMEHERLRTIDVIPVLAGSGNNGLWMLLAGLVIIAAALFLPIGAHGATLMTAWSSTAVTATFGQTLLFTVGLSVTLSGLSQLVTSTPNTETGENAANKPSYIYDGAVNTLRQGNPVPVGYGFIGCGSQVISAGIRSVDITDENA